VISAPAPPVNVQSKTELTFGSAGSTDAETPTSLTFYWIFGDGNVGAGQAPKHTYASAGTYTVILTVVDFHGGAASATLTVDVQNRAPTAVATADPSAVDTGIEVQFDGRASNDPDGTVAAWLWDFGDGHSSTEASPAHTYAASAPGGGAYSVRLTVTDNLGVQATTTLSLTVNNRLPTSAFVAPGEVFAGVAAVFRGGDSSDPDGLVLNWTWDFGDGAFGYGREAGHVFTTTGNVTVKLTVRDNSGGQAESSQSILVLVKPVFDDGKPGGGPIVGETEPGFEGVFVLVALVAVAGLALRGRGRRTA
jgi:PKD repeat protein